MDKFDKIMLSVVGAIALLSMFTLGWAFCERKYKHEAIVNHSAHYDVSEWGYTTFMWNKIDNISKL